MRRALVAFACLGLIAAELRVDDIRPVTDSSVQPFDVLMALSRAGNLPSPEQRADAYARTLAHDPSLQSARLGLGAALVDMDQAEEARGVLAGAGNSAEAQTLRLVVDVELGLRDDADVVLPNRFARYPDARLMNTLGRWLDARGRGGEARAAFGRAAPLQRAGLAEANAGASWRRQGNAVAAEASYRRAVALDPLDADFERGLRLSVLAQGDYSRALDGASAAQSTELLRAGAVRAVRAGEWRLARIMVARAAELSPRHDPVLSALMQELDEQIRNQSADESEHG